MLVHKVSFQISEYRYSTVLLVFHIPHDSELLGGLKSFANLFNLQIGCGIRVMLGLYPCFKPFLSLMDNSDECFARVKSDF